MRPLAIDLFCGLGGWAEGLLAEGWNVVGFDIERHQYGDHRYPGQLVIQDVRTIHGSQFRNAHLIVASPPCQEFSYMAMPFSRGKQIAAALRGNGDFPLGYTGSRTIAELTALFDACFRLQREASEAAGRHIPMVVENVKGAQPWVGRAKWHYGSYYLWGDVPALMPSVASLRKSKHEARHYGVKNEGQNWSRYKETGEVSPHWNVSAVKNPGHLNKRDGHTHSRHLTTPTEHVKQPGLSGPLWFDHGAASVSSKSPARKAASALIAKIPEPLSRHIARVYYPHRREQTA